VFIDTVADGTAMATVLMAEVMDAISAAGPVVVPKS
jgi:hypothetical protein